MHFLVVEGRWFVVDGIGDDSGDCNVGVLLAIDFGFLGRYKSKNYGVITTRTHSKSTTCNPCSTMTEDMNPPSSTTKDDVI